MLSAYARYDEILPGMSSMLGASPRKPEVSYFYMFLVCPVIPKDKSYLRQELDYEV